MDEPTAAAVDATHLTQRTTAREPPTPAALTVSDCEQSVGWSPRASMGERNSNIKRCNKATDLNRCQPVWRK